MTKTKEQVVSLVYQGQFQQARNLLLELLKSAPNDAELVFLLGNIHNRTGLYREAAQCFTQVLNSRPDLPSAHYNLGCAYRNMGRLAEAVDALKKATQLKPAFHEAWDTLGMVLAQLNMPLESVTCLKKALEIMPDYQSARENLGKAYDKAVAQWHFPMMNDAIRNDAYEDAIKRIVNPETIVLDIGTGSGLLSLMAARAGAKHVYTCEMNSLIADKAREIIAVNGFVDRITVLGMKSTDIRVGKDMPVRADVLVSEILDVGLLAEGVLSTVQHAKDNLLIENALIVPQEAEVYAVLLNSQELRNEYFVDRVSGFNLSPFNEFSTREYIQQRIDTFEHECLTDPTRLFSIRLDGSRVLPESVNIEVPVVRDGVCHAVAFWFRVRVFEDSSIDTGPGDKGCWKQAVMPLESPIVLSQSDTAVISAEHDCNRILVSGVSLKDG
jgi:predicted RNA methylase